MNFKMKSNIEIEIFEKKKSKMKWIVLLLAALALVYIKHII